MSAPKPRFLLKGLVCAEVVKQYRDGYFNQPHPMPHDIVFEHVVPTLSQPVGTNITHDVYTIKDRSTTRTYATTGHADLEVFNVTGDYPPGRCKGCLEDYTGDTWGTVVNYKAVQMLVGDTYRTVHVFWCMGKYCSAHCVLAYLMTQNVFTNPHIDQSMHLLRYLYKLRYPEAGPLLQTKPQGLAVTHGGSLNEEQMGDTNAVYIPRPAILCIPVKQEHLQRLLEPKITAADVAKSISSRNPLRSTKTL